VVVEPGHQGHRGDPHGISGQALNAQHPLPTPTYPLPGR
jgi:hypothetical protein